MFQTDYTMGPPLHYDPYHNSTIRTSLTRNIAPRFDDIRDEIECAFNDNLPLKDNGTAFFLSCTGIHMLITSRMEVCTCSHNSHEHCM